VFPGWASIVWIGMTVTVGDGEMVGVGVIFEPMCEAKVRDTASTGFVDQDVLGLDVPVDDPLRLVKVSKPSNDLAEHHANVIVRQTRPAVSLEDIQKVTSGAIEHEVKRRSARLFDTEQGEDVFMRESAPDLFLAGEPCTGFIRSWASAFERGALDDFDGYDTT
jgi:hypothetical protein